MRRTSLLNLALVAAIVAAVLFTPVRVVRASGIGFTGEAEDHFWDVTIDRFCKDGFVVLADEQPHSGEEDGKEFVNGDDLPFELHIGDSNIPISGLTATQKPLIAAGNHSLNSALVTGISATFFFIALQPPTKDAISVRIERWDHGLSQAEPETGGDGSPGDDVKYIPGGRSVFDPNALDDVTDCLVDTSAPTTTAAVSPVPNASGWNNTAVSVQLNAVDNTGGSGVQQITYSATGAQPIPSTTVPGSSASINITSEGITTISYFAMDISGNVEATHTQVVNIDTTAPTTTATTSPPSSGGWSNPPVTVQLNASDNLSGVQQITYSATGAQPVPSTTVSGASASIAITTLGTTTISFAATDNAGNAEATKTQVIQITTRAVDGLQALYLFDENGGTIVHDRAGVGAPLDLTVPDPAAVGWSPSGLVISSTTVLSSTVPATRLTTAMSNTNELAIEAWITPSDPTDSGLGRIVTLSANAATRDVTLAQGQLGGGQISYNARLHTHHPGAPTPPTLASPDDLVSSTLTHLVYTRDASGLARLYVNGVEVAHASQLGDLSDWVQSYHLALANEPSGDRPWLGAYHLVALYNRALSPAEVRQKFQAGP